MLSEDKTQLKKRTVSCLRRRCDGREFSSATSSGGRKPGRRGRGQRGREEGATRKSCCSSYFCGSRVPGFRRCRGRLHASSRQGEHSFAVGELACGRRVKEIEPKTSEGKGPSATENVFGREGCCSPLSPPLFDLSPRPRAAPFLLSKHGRRHAISRAVSALWRCCGSERTQPARRR